MNEQNANNNEIDLTGVIETLSVDVRSEIYTANGDFFSNKSSDDELETEPTSDTFLDDFIDDFLGEDLSNGEGLYPHQLNPDLEFSPYNAVYNDGTYLHVDDKYLVSNLHWKPDFDYNSCSWKPRSVKDYRDCRRVYLDIETLGLDPLEEGNRIIMIGIMIEGAYPELDKRVYESLSKGYVIEGDEKQMLDRLFRTVAGLKPDAVVLHNGFNFDLPFIIARSEKLGVNHPLCRLTEKERFITAASMFGKPISFYPVYWTKPNGYYGNVLNNGSFPQIVDTMHLAGQHDKIFANMTSYGLKYLAHYVGYRKEKRLELKYHEIVSYWKSGDPDKIQLVRDYLIFDLEDQRAVTNFFLVSPWYQQMYFPLALQEICVASPARKHNANLDAFYKKYYGKQLPDGRYYQKPVAQEKLKYGGGYVSINPGLYQNFFKVDVSSMHPSNILTKGLMNRVKDPMMVFLKTIDTLRSLRYVYKDLGGNNPEKAKTRKAYQDMPHLFTNIDFSNISKDDKATFKGIDNSLKVGINGGYGFLGTGGYNFNDIESAALTTAYSRIFITAMVEVAEKMSTVISCVTGDTLVLTGEGYFPICELAGYDHEILNGNNEWVFADFFKAGNAKIYEITFKRNYHTQTIRVTDNHKWFVKDYGLSRHKGYTVQKFMTTIELLNVVKENSYRFSVNRNLAPKPRIVTNSEKQDYVNGVAHGIIYSDGSKAANCNGYYLQLVGNKNELDVYLRQANILRIVTHKPCDRRSDSFKYYFNSINKLKELPVFDDVSNAYLLGFFRGMIACDGSICGRDGTVDISGQKDTCEFIEKIAPCIGFETTRVNLCNKAGRKTVIKGKTCEQKTDVYKVFFSVDCIKKEDLLRSFHSDKFDNCRKSTTKDAAGWRIVKVVETNDYEDVYCCTEPNTHRFTLYGGIDSGNSDTDGLLLHGHRITDINPELLEIDYKHPSTGQTVQVDDGKGNVNPEYVWCAIQSVLPEGISVDLELNCPDGAIYAPKMKNYLYWESPDKKPKAKGVFRKRNRSELQKAFPIEYLRRFAFESKESANEYFNECVTKLTGTKLDRESVTITRVIEEKDKALLAANLGIVGETVSFYWGTRQHYTKAGRKNGSKPFPIRVPILQELPDGINLDDIDMQVNLNVYVASSTTYGNLKDNVREITFTQRIGKADKKLTGAGIGEVGDQVNYFWASIQGRTPTGKLCAKRDRFPVRVVISEDEKDYSLCLQDLPPDINRDDIVLEINREWYLADLVKMRDDILKVVC